MKTDTLKEIINKLGEKEGEHIEFKLSTSALSKDIWETVSAFSNEGSGIILLGYKKLGDRYVPVGVKDPTKILDDFTSTVSQKFNFCPVVSANIVEDEGKPIIIIEVKEAPRYQKPIYIKDADPLKGGFKRVGATDIRLTDGDVYRYYLERMGAPDAQPANGTILDDIDPATLSAFRNLRKLINPNAPELSFDDKELLKAYNLLTKDSQTLTTAGLLLFGKEQIVKTHFPAVRLDIIRIKGIEWGKDRDPFLSRDLTGNLITLRSSAIDFLDRFFLIPFHADERGERIEENAHRKALREALTNLLMHQNIRHDTFTLVLPHPIVEITEQVTEQVTNMMDRRAMTLEFCKEPRSLKEIMQFLGLKHRPNFIENVLNPLLKAGLLKRTIPDKLCIICLMKSTSLGLLKRTIPDKPRSRFQKYVAKK